MDYLKHRFSFTQVDEEDPEEEQSDEEEEHVTEKKSFLDSIASKKDSLLEGLSSKLRRNQEEDVPESSGVENTAADNTEEGLAAGDVPHAAKEEQAKAAEAEPEKQAKPSVFSALATKLKFSAKSSKTTEEPESDSKRFVWRKATMKSHSTDYESEGERLLEQSGRAADEQENGDEQEGVFGGLISKLKRASTTDVAEKLQPEEGEDQEKAQSTSATDKFWQLTAKLKSSTIGIDDTEEDAEYEESPKEASVPFWSSFKSRLTKDNDENLPDAEEVKQEEQEEDVGNSSTSAQQAQPAFWEGITSRFQRGDKETVVEQETSGDAPSMSKREAIWNGITSKLRGDGTSEKEPNKDSIWSELTAKLQSEKAAESPSKDEQPISEDGESEDGNKPTFWNGLTSKFKGQEEAEENVTNSSGKGFWGGITSKIKEQTIGGPTSEKKDGQMYGEISSSPAKGPTFWGGITSKLKSESKSTTDIDDGIASNTSATDSPRKERFWSGMGATFQSVRGGGGGSGGGGGGGDSEGSSLFGIVKKKWASMSESRQDSSRKSPSPSRTPIRKKSSSTTPTDNRQFSTTSTEGQDPSTSLAVSSLVGAASTSSLIKIDQSSLEEPSDTDGVDAANKPTPRRRSSRSGSQSSKAAEDLFLQQQSATTLMPRKETPILTSPNRILQEFRFSVDEPDVNGNQDHEREGDRRGNLMEFGSRPSLAEMSGNSHERKVLSVESGLDSDISSEPEYSENTVTGGGHRKKVLSGDSTESMDDVSRECRQFADEFVMKVFQSEPIDAEAKAKFGSLIQDGLFRQYFARSVSKERSAQQKVSEGVYYQLVQYFALVLFECEQADDYTPAKTLMNMCFTFYYEVPVEGGEHRKHFLYTSLKSQAIWKSMRFWNAAFYDEVQMERCKKPITTNSDHQEAVEDDREFQENVFYGQLGTFLHNMCEFGISRPWCMEFLRKQSTIGNLKTEQIRTLRKNVEAWTDVTRQS